MTFTGYTLFVLVLGKEINESHVILSTTRGYEEKSLTFEKRVLMKIYGSAQNERKKIYYEPEKGV